MMYTPKEVAVNYIGIGVGKTRLPLVKMFLLGVLAGMFIALAGVASTTAAVSVDAPSLGKMIGALVFPAGLAMVLLAGSELFTGNCLLIIPLLSGKASLGGVLKNWIVVYIGNFAGGVLVALLEVYSHLGGLFGGDLAASMVNTAVTKVSMGFGDALLRGILCNVLVCIAVWISFAAKSVGDKILGLYFPVMLFVLCGFEHCIANMYFISAGIFASSVHGLAAEGLGWGSFLINNLLPVTIGNLIGGLAVGGAYWMIYLREEKTA